MNALFKIVITTWMLIFSIAIHAQNNDLLLAQQYYIQGDFEKALVYYEKIFKKDQSHPVFTRYYECLLKTNDLKEAEKVIKRQINKNPNNLSYPFQYGEFLEDNERTKEANQLYSQLIKEKATNTMVLKDLYNSFMDVNKLNYAKQTLDVGRKSLGNRYPLNMEYAELYYRELNYNKMMDEYIHLIDLAPVKRIDVEQRLSDLIEENDDNNDFQNAVKNKILAKTQKEADNYLYADMLIWYFSQRKQFSIALTQVKALDKREKGEGKRVFELGRICVQNKDYTTASNAFKYIADMESSYLKKEAKKELLKVRFLEITEVKGMERTLVDEVIREYQEVIDEINNPRVSFELIKQQATIQAYYANQAETAIQSLKSLVNVPSIPFLQRNEIKVLLADIYVLTNEIWEASLLYMQVDSELKYEPIGFEAKYKNAKIFYYTGDFKFAQSQLDVLKQSTTKLIANDAMKLSVLITDNFGLDSNYKAMSLFAHADMLLEQHLYDEAFKLYDSLIKEHPTSGLIDDIALRKGLAMMDLGKWDKAIEYLTLIVSNYSYDILIDDALFNLGKIYEEHKYDSEKATEYYKQILFDHPESLYSAEARERIRKLRGG